MSELSVVVCTYRRQRLLPAVLDHLLQQTAPPGEVLVVDNEVSSQTEALVGAVAARAAFPVRYLPEVNLGLSHARNRGVKECREALVAFLDDDAFAAPTWAAELCAGAARRSGGGVFAGAVEPISEGPVPPHFLEQLGGYAAWLSVLDLGSEDQEMRTQGAAYAGPVGANMAFRRKVLTELGGFNPQLGRMGASLVSGEEVALVNAARRAGYEVWYLGKARVQHLVHRERLTPEWFIHRSYFEGVSIARALRSEGQGDESKRCALFREQALQAMALFERAGRGLGSLNLRSRIELAKIVGRLVETSGEPAVGASSTDIIEQLRGHREILELGLPAEGAQFWAQR